MLQFVRRATVLRGPLRPAVCLGSTRLKRYEAFDAQFDQDELAEARKWYQSFKSSRLPRGSTTYARSSGPGGQHVNK